MSRLIDKIFKKVRNPATANRNEDQYAYEDSKYTAKWRQYLMSAQVVTIDNVAEYFFAQTKQPHVEGILEKWTLTDFPVITPPFPRMFVEYHIPDRVFDEASYGPLSPEQLSEFRADRKRFPRHTGILFSSMTPDEFQSVLADLGESYQPPYDCKWVVRVQDFCLTHRGCLGPFTGWLFFLTDEGKPILLGGDGLGGDGKYWVRMWVNDIGGSHKLRSDEARMISTDRMILGVYPALFAISLMHCKNVQMVENTPTKTQQRERRKTSAWPLVRYHTLNIDPMKSILHTQGNVETLGLKKALHICRGHFSNYTQGKGLFGKYKGVFWVPQHLRGSAEQGAIVKDYAVKAPEDFSHPQ